MSLSIGKMMNANGLWASKRAMWRRLRFSLAIGLIVSLVGTASMAFSQRPDPDEMYPLASAAQRLATAVQGAVAYKNPPPDLSEEELLEFATKHDPRLLAPYGDRRIRVTRFDKASAILICERGEDRAVIEDSGCTADTDAHHWQSDEPLPCEFTLPIQKLCGQ
jgi:hypothetical protein